MMSESESLVQRGMRRLIDNVSSASSLLPHAKTQVMDCCSAMSLRLSWQDTSQSGRTPRPLGNGSKSVNVHGAEAFVLVSVIVGLLVVSVLGTGASLYLMFKLRLFPGSEMISFADDGSVHFNHGVEMGSVHLMKDVLSGVQSIDGNVLMQAGPSKLSVSEKGIDISAPQGFRVISKSGEKIFPVNFGSLALPSSLSSLSLSAGAKNVKKIRSPVDQDLEISGGSVKIGGSQGIRVEGREVAIGGRDILLSSQNGSIILDASHGLYMPGLHEAKGHAGSGKLQYKLCVCGRSGRLFKLHMKRPDTSCADVRFPESDNPCV